MLNEFDCFMINILRDNNLRSHNTFGIEATTLAYATFSSKYDLPTIFDFTRANHMDWYVLGQGSNTIFTGDYNGVIIHPAIKRLSIISYGRDTVMVRAEAGVVWDEFVGFCVKNELYGAENLSGIPGSVGASPVQNIGAYGTEAKDIIRGVEYYNVKTDSHMFIDGIDCKFGYRESIFKTELKGQAVITAVLFELSTKPKYNLDYGDLKRQVEMMGDLSVSNVRKAVMYVRDSKIPDPKVLGNAGSFFKNPMVNNDTAERLKREFPDMPVYTSDKGTKLPAGWLIDKAGWRGFRNGNVGVNDKQALILVNYGGATGAEVINLASNIQKDVMKKFGVKIDMEVNIL